MGGTPVRNLAGAQPRQRTRQALGPAARPQTNKQRRDTCRVVRLASGVHHTDDAVAGVPLPLPLPLPLPPEMVSRGSRW